MQSMKIAILGSGVMGSQIALEFAQHNFIVYLFDQSIEESNQLAIDGVDKTIDNISAKELTNGQSTKEIYTKAKNNIKFCTYKDNLNQLENCDLIIEAIVEDIKIKQELYLKIKSYIKPTAFLATNTSGLSIEDLSKFAHDKTRFCGIHFFNPPRSLKLIEYIPVENMHHDITKILELLKSLKFNVIKVKDTPNFIVNKIGFFAWNLAVHSADKYNISINIVDELTNAIIGRSKSATYRTADIVGLDIVKHVLKTFQNLEIDNFKDWYAIPKKLEYLISRKALGQKTKMGFYKKHGDKILIWDENIDNITPQYIESNQKADSEVLSILNSSMSVEDKLIVLNSISNSEALFVVDNIKILKEYINFYKNKIAYQDEDIKQAMHDGFAWSNVYF